MDFTFEEIMLMAIYNSGSREGLMENLARMRKYLDPDEVELLCLTDSVLEKLNTMTEEEFETVDLVVDLFDMEDADAE